MPVQAPQWTDFLSCPICYNEFECHVRRPISLGCGHTMCKSCLSKLQRKHCPFDQTAISTDINHLPENYALLQLVGGNVPEQPSSVAPLVSKEDFQYYMEARKCIEELALYLKASSAGVPNGILQNSSLSRSMQRKLVTLINCQLVEEEGRSRGMRAARSLGERSVTELILQHQNPQQLSANLWAAVRARGCQFLGPAMQEEVLKLVLLALEDGSALSRKVLVMFVVQRLAPHFPQASKTSIGHVVQLLYRASCFMVSKREGDSSLMQLKEEFCTYEALRREHDAQIVQIATEAGLRIAPEQWSSLLYGDTTHKSHMQSIIDKLQTPQSFSQSVQELVIALQRTGDPGNLSVLRPHLELLAGIDSSPDAQSPSWEIFKCAQEATKIVVKGLIEFLQNFGNRRLQEDRLNLNAKYKTSMCRDLTQRRNCPRGLNCTFAHSQEELEKFRAKGKRTAGCRNSGSARSPNPDSSSNPDVSYVSSSPEAILSASECGVSNFVYDLPYISDCPPMTDVVPSESSHISLCNFQLNEMPCSPDLHALSQPSQLLNPNSPAFQPLSTAIIQPLPSSSKIPCSMNPISPQPTVVVSTMQNTIAELPKPKPRLPSKCLPQSVLKIPECHDLNATTYSSPVPVFHSVEPIFKASHKSGSQSQPYTPVSEIQQSQFQTLAALQKRKRQLLAQLHKAKLPKTHFITVENGTQPPVAGMSYINALEGGKVQYGFPWASPGPFFCGSSVDGTGSEYTRIPAMPPEEVDPLDAQGEENKCPRAEFGDYGLFCPSEKDEFIPFDRPLVSKYGPISRCSKRMMYGPAPIQVNAVPPMNELTSPTSAVLHPLPSSSFAPSYNPSTIEAESVILFPESEKVKTSKAAKVCDDSLDSSLHELHMSELIRSQELSRLLEEELWEVEKMIQEQEEKSDGSHNKQKHDAKSGGLVPTSIGPWPSQTLEYLPFKHSENLPCNEAATFED